MKTGLSKEQQLKKNKDPTEKIPWGMRKSKGGFGTKKYHLKKRSDKTQSEKIEKSNPFYDWIHNSGQVCAVCGCSDIDIHHITDLKNIKGKRRSWDRVIVLCKAHHKGDSLYHYNGNAIHVLSKERFYATVMSFEEMMRHSDSIYEEYLNYKEIK